MVQERQRILRDNLKFSSMNSFSLPTLLNAAEVVSFGGSQIDNSFPTYKIKNIHAVEFHAFSNHLGEAFQESLHGDLVDYSGTLEYAIASTYNMGDVVAFEGLYYKSLTDTNNSEAGTEPFWELAPKFTSDDNNVLWVNFLGKYLSYLVLDHQMSGDRVQHNGVGLITVQGQTFRPANDKEAEGKHSSLRKDIRIAFDNLIGYLKKNASKYPTFSESGSIEGTDEDCKLNLGNNAPDQHADHTPRGWNKNERSGKHIRFQDGNDGYLLA